MTPEEWMAKHDKHFWVTRPKMAEVNALFEKQFGRKPKRGEIKSLREEHCSYWGVERFCPPYRGTALTESEWTQVASFLRMNTYAIKHESLDFLIRLGRLQDVPINRDILLGSSTYKRLKYMADAKTKHESESTG